MTENLSLQMLDLQRQVNDLLGRLAQVESRYAWGYSSPACDHPDVSIWSGNGWREYRCGRCGAAWSKRYDKGQEEEVTE